MLLDRVDTPAIPWRLLVSGEGRWREVVPHLPARNFESRRRVRQVVLIAGSRLPHTEGVSCGEARFVRLSLSGYERGSDAVSRDVTSTEPDDARPNEERRSDRFPTARDAVFDNAHNLSVPITDTGPRHVTCRTLRLALPDP